MAKLKDPRIVYYQAQNFYPGEFVRKLVKIDMIGMIHRSSPTALASDCNGKIKVLCLYFSFLLLSTKMHSSFQLFLLRFFLKNSWLMGVWAFPSHYQDETFICNFISNQGQATALRIVYIFKTCKVQGCLKVS